MRASTRADRPAGASLPQSSHCRSRIRRARGQPVSGTSKRGMITDLACMGCSMSRHLRPVSLFDQRTVSSPRPATSSRCRVQGAVKAGRLGGHPKGSALISVEHGGILQAVGARSPRTTRGEPAVGRNESRRKLVFGGSKRILTTMQSFASAARLRAVGPFSSSALKPFQMSGSPPPRIVINSPPSDR